jgi:hypothetical protein
MHRSRGRGLVSFVVVVAFAAMVLATKKPGSDVPAEIEAAAPAVTTVAPPATVPPVATPSAPPAADAPKPPNPDHSCDPKNDTTCEFNEKCVAGGKKGTNGAGKCTVGCPAGLAPGPGGCGKKCASDSDCDPPTGTMKAVCSQCKKCKEVKDPPRGKICQTS